MWFFIGVVSGGLIGDKIDFYHTEIVGEQIGDNHYRASINYPEILLKLNTADTIYLYDGAIKATVTETNEEFVRVVVDNMGVLSSRKGLISQIPD